MTLLFEFFVVWLTNEGLETVPAETYLFKLTIETLEKGGKYVQS